MDKKDNKTLAFPISHEHGYEHGMTLRDYMAAKALSAMELPWDGAYSQGDRKRGEPGQHAEWYAISAYRIADAMLKVRKL